MNIVNIVEFIIYFTILIFVVFQILSKKAIFDKILGFAFLASVAGLVRSTVTYLKNSSVYSFWTFILAFVASFLLFLALLIKINKKKKT